MDDHTLKLFALVILLLPGLAAPDSEFNHCESVVKRWASSALEQEVVEDKHTLRDLLFFLHVPRTGGRVYSQCFLKMLYLTSEECPRSYDKLQFDPRKRDCRFLMTHDDYSMMSKLPKDKTSVVTILRNPVDRVFSTYEFSVEVAARSLGHPNITYATQRDRFLSSLNIGVNTLDIWPWKYLVSWMREDLFDRRDARKVRGTNEVKGDNPFDMEEMVMPLHKFITDPIAHDIVHNGATFQIAGLTNNSYFMESHEVRHCVQQYRDLGPHVLEVAKKKLDDMLYVGLTEDHKESAIMFANVVGAQLISHGLSTTSSTGLAVNIDSEQKLSTSDTNFDNVDHQTSTSDCITSETSSKENPAVKIAVKKLMEAYEGCSSGFTKMQGSRRTVSLRRISPAKFSKEDRTKVPEIVIKQIESLNSLDLELYRYAQHIFAKQQS